MPDRAGISSALVVDGATYLIDCGRGAVTQYQRAGLAYSSLQGIFLTHLHADHIADYYNFLLLAGITALPNGDVIRSGLPVYGPGRAGALAPAFGGRTVPTVNPENPTPGTDDLTRALHAAYAYSSNVLMRDTGMRDIRSLVDVQEITLPSTVTASASGAHAPSMTPFPVMEDDRVRVTAILVPHGPVFPSFAYRFETDHGAVTFSGDTRTSDNLVTLARSSDVLVHEAINDPTEMGLAPTVVDHMLQSHVVVGDTGGIAHRADVPHLVLSHIVDFTGPINVAKWESLARRGYSGKVTVGEDLMRIPVRAQV